jgi:hypothetical protein
MNDLWRESSFTSIVEELMRPEWEAQGRTEGMRDTLRGVLESRFATLPADLLAALNAADEATLRALTPTISTGSLDEVRARLGLSAS